MAAVSKWLGWCVFAAHSAEPSMGLVVLFSFVLSCLVWSCLFLSCLVSSRLVLSCHVLSCLVLFCPTPLNLRCVLLSCFLLSCRVLCSRVCRLKNGEALAVLFRWPYHSHRESFADLRKVVPCFFTITLTLTLTFICLVFIYLIFSVSGLFLVCLVLS